MRKNAPHPIAFVITSTDHGTFLVNRNDHTTLPDGRGSGLGYQLFANSLYEYDQVALSLQLLETRQQNFGNGVVAIDCGANIGIYTVEWARLMSSWGQVISFEAQERIFYALAGNITINNCFNAKPIWAALGAKKGTIEVPMPNYLIPSSFGSLEIRQNPSNEFIGQRIDYSKDKTITTAMISIDDLNLKRLDFMKIDIEGMEMEALVGAQNSIKTLKPQILIETIKSNENDIRRFLGGFGYKFMCVGDLLAVHESDPTAAVLKLI